MCVEEKERMGGRKSERVGWFLDFNFLSTIQGHLRLKREKQGGGGGGGGGALIVKLSNRFL